MLPFFFALVCSVFSCGKDTDGKDVSMNPGTFGTKTETLPNQPYPVVLLDTSSAAGLVDSDCSESLAARIAAAFDDRQLAAQVIISGIDGMGQLTPDMRTLLTECPAGGVILFRYNLSTGNDAIRDLVKETGTLIASGAVPKGNGEKSDSPAEGDSTVTPLPAVPPFVAVDHEGGTVNRFRPGVADLPPASSYWETVQGKNGVRSTRASLMQIASDSYYAGRAIAGLGINLNFAPVAEYLNKNNGDFLSDRSYGPDPVFTAGAASAFIEGMDLAGVLCAVKHFPGSAGADPHFYPSVLRENKAALTELTAPFESLIRDGRARAIMVSHSAIPALDNENIASLSPAVLGGWLRGELGFEGIIICDDFSMAAGSAGVQGAGNESRLRPETAAVRSFAAGADMVLVWPPDLRRTHREIQAALNDGRLSRERLRESAERIIIEKIRLGLID